MDAADLDDDATPPVLPKEGERRIVEDADARGIAVVLQGGETWYVPPLPLSPRGQRIAELLDALERHEVDHAAAQRTVAVVSDRLDAASSEADIEEARLRLASAVEKRTKVADVLASTHREIAFHALRTHYRVTRDEAGVLVTQRHWPDVIAALNGRDTTRSQEEMALALLTRLKAIQGEVDSPAGPFDRPAETSSAGRAAS